LFSREKWKWNPVAELFSLFLTSRIARKSLLQTACYWVPSAATPHLLLGALSATGLPLLLHQVEQNINSKRAPQDPRVSWVHLGGPWGARGPTWSPRPLLGVPVGPHGPTRCHWDAPEGDVRAERNEHDEHGFAANACDIERARHARSTSTRLLLSNLARSHEIINALLVSHQSVRMMCKSNIHELRYTTT